MAKYHRLGLRIVAFHRPEFEFEESIRNVANFVQSFAIDYPVGLDNDSEGWRAWKVDSWPTHFLVPRPLKVGSPLVKVGDPHIGDRRHDELEKAIVDALITRTTSEDIKSELKTLRDSIVPLNRDVFYDMEFFLGSDHTGKNVPTNGGSQCEDGICKFVPKRFRAEKSSSPGRNLFEFGRNGHSGYVKLGSETVEWVPTSEFCAPTQDAWDIDLMFNLSTDEDELVEVSVYMVAEPQEGSICNVAVTRVEVGGAEVNCVVGAADRHYLGRHTNGSTLQISGDVALRVYSFYITTETTMAIPLAADICATAPCDSESDVDTPRLALKQAPRAPKNHRAVVPAIRRLQTEAGLERRPTGKRAKPRAVQPTAQDEPFLMPEASDRSTSLRIFAA